MCIKVVSSKHHCPPAIIPDLPSYIQILLIDQGMSEVPDRPADLLALSSPHIVCKVLGDRKRVIRHPRKIAAHEAVDLIGYAGRRVKTANVECVSSFRKEVEGREEVDELTGCLGAGELYITGWSWMALRRRGPFY